MVKQSGEDHREEELREYQDLVASADFKALVARQIEAGNKKPQTA